MTFFGERKIQESMPARLAETERFQIPDGCLRLSESFFSIEGEGLLMGTPCYLVRFAGCNLRCGFCAVGSSKVTMEKGNAKRLDQLKVGDRVISWKAGKLVVGEVAEVFSREVSPGAIFEIKLESGRQLFVTKEHPFWVKGKWISVEKLQVGDELLNLLPGQVISFKKIRDNPMWRPEVRARGLATKADRKSRGLYPPVKRSLETRLLYSLRMRGSKNPMKNPEVAARGYTQREGHQSQLEKKIEDLIHSLGLPVKYTGDGQKWIGDKTDWLINPDFVVKNQKKVIEVFDPNKPIYVKGVLRPRGNYRSRKRQDHYRKYGYTPLMLPLTWKNFTRKNLPAVVEKLSTFVMNGDRIVSISHPTGRQLRRLGTSGQGKGKKTDDPIKVYNIKTSTHNYFLNGVLSHNCDTKFSSWYDTDAATEPWITVFQEIVKHPGWVSYTGGEPFFRQENELRAWAELVMKVDLLGRPQKVETSGTVDPPDWFPDEVFFYSIAPKTAGMGKGTFLDPVLLEHLLTKHAMPNRAHIKFVIGAREKDGTLGADFQAIKELMVAVPSLKKYPIIFQPEGLTGETSEYLDRCRMLVEAVKNDPEIMAIPDWRVLPQWHTLLWKNARRR